MNKKINIALLILGIFIILSSILTYLMIQDEVSLGIAVFAGIGIVLYAIKNKFSAESSLRVVKYANTFLFGAGVIFVYWFLKVKLGLF